MTVRPALPDDEPALRDIDLATWTAAVSPAPPPATGAPFFSERNRPADVLVAEIDGSVAGYAELGQSLPIPAHDHVLDLRGLAVDPARQRRGAGRGLVLATAQEARRRGARKLALRVLSVNVGARGLYESCGFIVEGVLKAEFLLGGQYVDDIVMACLLPAQAPGAAPGR